MTSVDLFAIKERIVAILKADTTNLWWTNSNPSTKTRFRKIEAGSPSPRAMEEPPLPRLWVTDEDTIAVISNFSHVSSNANFATTYKINMKIIFVVEAKDGPKTEEDCDDFCKVIIEKLQGNFDLRTDGGAESGQLAIDTEFTRIEKLKGLKGDRVQGRILRFIVTTLN
jgi:hypothetical protein